MDQDCLWKSQRRNPKDIRKTLVISTTLLDANLLHEIVTGKSVTAVLHFVKHPHRLFSKRQATVEIAIHGSEFVAAKTATEQTMDLRNTLRYLGVPS